MLREFLIIFALAMIGLVVFAVLIIRELFCRWNHEVILRAETKRQLEYALEQKEFWRKMYGEKEDVLDAEIIK